MSARSSPGLRAAPIKLDGSDPPTAAQTHRSATCGISAALSLGMSSAQVPSNDETPAAAGVSGGGAYRDRTDDLRLANLAHIAHAAPTSELHANGTVSRTS